jgi:chromosome segregation ATPase
LSPDAASTSLWNYIRAAEEMERRSFEQRQAHVASLKAHCTNLTASFNSSMDAQSAQHAVETGTLIEAKTQLTIKLTEVRAELGQSTSERLELKSRLSATEGKLRVADKDRTESAKALDTLAEECTRLTDQNEKITTALEAMTAEKDRLLKQLELAEVERLRLVRDGEETTAKCNQLEKQRDGYRTSHGKLKEAILQQRLERQRREYELEQSLLAGLDVDDEPSSHFSGAVRPLPRFGSCVD